MILISTVFHSITHLLFPRLCPGCGSDLIDRHHPVCVYCHQQLAETDFASIHENPLERTFWGRLDCRYATSLYYFTKDSVLQRLIHLFKYKHHGELAHYFGMLMGESIKDSGRFPVPDVLVPLPLFPDREYKRGYNQAALLCKGMAEVLQIPVIKDAVIRIRYTDSQTLKTRMERWENVEGVFQGLAHTELSGKNILLVDDVITTGATLEACGNAILEDIPSARLSIATLAFAIH